MYLIVFFVPHPNVYVMYSLLNKIHSQINHINVLVSDLPMNLVKNAKF